MIYRACDCGVFDSQDDAMFVWFSAASDREASAKLPKLLTTGWDVDADRLYFGNIDSEMQLAGNSLQPPKAGDRRWYESGSRGDWPFYYRTAELVMLPHRDLNRLYDAKAAAVMHARELSARCTQEIAALSSDAQNDRRIADLRYDQIAYDTFADQSIGYARARRTVIAPLAVDVRKLRERHQLTQSAAAHLVYVTLNAWQKWEQGERKMDRRTWELLLYKLREECH
jgi:DNA-binding transcriptional regulator YiaG